MSPPKGLREWYAVKLKQTKNSQGTPRVFPAFSFGVIRADEAYTLEEFKRRVGKKDAGLRSARRAGLRVFQEGKQRYVLGRDWIVHLLKTAGHRDGKRGCGHA